VGRDSFDPCLLGPFVLKCYITIGYLTLSGDRMLRYWKEIPILIVDVVPVSLSPNAITKASFGRIVKLANLGSIMVCILASRS